MLPPKLEAFLGHLRGPDLLRLETKCGRQRLCVGWWKDATALQDHVMT